MPRPITALRAAFGLSVFFTLAHTAGTLNTSTRGPAEEAALAGLRGFRFTVMGVERSHWDFYFGLGLFLSLNLALLSVLLWMLGSMARTDPLRVRPFVAVLGWGHLAMAALCAWKFFPAPLFTTLATAIALGVAWRGLGTDHA